MTQQALSLAMGFADRQTLSAIENGERRVQSAELVRFSDVLERPIDWFIDPFVIAGEAQFSWRVAKDVSDEALDAYEAKIGQWVGLLRHLRRALLGPSRALSQYLPLPVNPTFEDAWQWGEKVVAELDLGQIPAERLVERVESGLGIPVLFVDALVGTGSNEISGAMCRLPDLGVIVINRRESPVRRHFDLAHELFHALTWDAKPPERREDPDAKAIRRSNRTEALADNFAAAVLMPTASLTALLDPARLDDVDHLAGVAQQLQVSTQALAWRLYNIKMIDKPTCAALCKLRTPRLQGPVPQRLSPSYVALLHDGIARGHVAARKAAKALSMTLEELAGLLREHDKSVPFAV